ncbi:PulJ/GspJ family protein [Microbacterium sp. GXF6406]
MANRLKRLDRRERDAGFTLLEIIVAMGIFSLFLAMFLGTVISVTRATTQAKVDAQTSSAIGIAVQRVERSVRYADTINYPGATAGFAYVEWRTDAVSATSGAVTCTQLRYSEEEGTIAMRSWPANESPSSGTWSVLLRDVMGEAADDMPFRVVTADGVTSNYQGLTLDISAGISDAAGTSTRTTIYAKNSSVNSPSNTAAANGQSMTPVCTGMSYRP